MRSSFVWLLAWRLLGSRRADSLIATMVLLCTLSIALGTGALALALAITQGFDAITLRTLQGMSPDLIIRTCSSDDQLVADPIISSIKTKCSDEIVNLTGCSIHHALVQNSQSQESISGFTTLHTIDTSSFGSVINIPFVGAAVGCTDSPLQRLKEHTIILGSEFARQLRVRCGDTVVVRYPDDEVLHGGKLSLASSRAVVVGIFRSGIEEWDAHSAFISRQYATLLFDEGNGVDYIGIKVADGVSMQAVQRLLRDSLKLDVVSWKDLNPTIISALLLEQIAVFCIVGLIILIAGVTIMALLCMILLYHEKTIAILLAHGMSQRALRITIILYSVLLTLRAALYGIFGAALISYVVDTYKLIALPEMYYSTHLPAHMSLGIVLVVITLALVTSLCATYYPVYRLRTISIVHILMR